MIEISRRHVLATAAGALGGRVAAASPGERSDVLDDASRRNATPVFRHWVATPDPEKVFVAQLRQELAEAAAAGRPVAVGAARHSLGGQSLPLNGSAITLDRGRCEPDVAGGVYRISGGARWRDVIATLDPFGWSPKVMQSNNDFGVAASTAVNAHGWPTPFGPLGTTVRSLRVMLADGAILACSRTQNAELFGLAVGGYGLVGVILDLELEMTPNAWLGPAVRRLRSARVGSQLVQMVEDPGVRMAYGRLSLHRERFLSEAEIVGFHALPQPTFGLPPATSGGLLYEAARLLYRAQIGSDFAKRLRWLAETRLAPELAPKGVTRNRLLNEPIAHLAGGPTDRTDMLHEYFVPPENLEAFLVACRALIPPSGMDLINVTLRYVAADDVSALAYAPGPRLATVMLFSQPNEADAEIAMAKLTRDLIESALALGGAFYLPYRLHARIDQVVRAYPSVQSFVAAKRRYDPGLIFRNRMWDAYFA